MEKIPPKFVPTLTQEVPSVTPDDVDAAVPVDSTGNEAPSAEPQEYALPNAAALEIRQRVLQHVTERVMQQIQTTLEQQIREAVAGVALAHAYAIARDLEPAIEGVVTAALSQALQDALAKELQDKSGFN
jgi:Tfp pilus assembly PilM family ATPase